MSESVQLVNEPPLQAQAEHGWICRRPDDRLGYFGWPSVVRLSDGRVAAAVSGPRASHVCLWGRTSLFYSADDGRTWSGPDTVNNTPLDDRDAGLLRLPNGDILLTWFISDIRHYLHHSLASLDTPAGRYWAERWPKAERHYDDATVKAYQGSWLRISRDDCYSWSAPIRMAVTSPHGPCALADGTVLYLGKRWTDPSSEQSGTGEVLACLSADGGVTWTEGGAVDAPDGQPWKCFHEPHAVACADGSVLGLFRADPGDNEKVLPCLYQTRSTDGGGTWEKPVPTHMGGPSTPPHLLRLADGSILCTYGYRLPKFGVRARLSRDHGRTWGREWILRDDGLGGDLGYAASEVMPDGTFLTVYYMGKAEGEPCSFAWTRWTPEA